MDFRLRIYKLACTNLPRGLRDFLGSMKLTASLRNGLFRKAGLPRLVQVESAIGEFTFTAPIQVAHKAATRGIEPTISRLLQRICRPGAICIDVGASYGFLTLVMATCVKPNGRVVSFEPNDFAHRTLVQNIAHNDVADVCTIYHAALSSHKTLKFGVVSWLGSSHFPENGEHVNSVVPAFTLDQIVQDQLLSHVNVIKIDVDGIEWDILSGASTTIDRFHPIIIVEMNKSTDNIVRMLRGKGYSLFNLQGDSLSESTELVPSNIVACTEKQSDLVWNSDATNSTIF